MVLVFLERAFIFHGRGFELLDGWVLFFFRLRLRRLFLVLVLSLLLPLVLLVVFLHLLIFLNIHSRRRRKSFFLPSLFLIELKLKSLLITLHCVRARRVRLDSNRLLTWPGEIHITFRAFSQSGRSSPLHFIPCA